MLAVKDKGAALLTLIQSLGGGRELSIAATKTEEAVMWAVKQSPNRCPMDEAKKWFESVGVWGGLVSVIAGGAGLFGYSVTPDDQAMIATGLQKAFEIVTSLGALVGGGIAIFGRVRASKTIVKSAAPSP